MIPKTSGGFDFYGLFNKYIEAINKDIGPRPDETLWWCGRVLKEGGTKFIHQNFGITEMRKVPRFLAEKLGNNLIDIMQCLNFHV